MIALLQSLPERYGRPSVRGTYLLPLDGLRALAIAIVIVWHIGIRVFRLTLPGPLVTSDDAGFLHWLPHGEIGVSLFFFISGFIIVRPFLSREEAMDGRAIRSFYLRRLVRIAPPHVLLITAAFLLLAVAGYRPARAVSFEAAHQSLAASYAASVLYLNGLIFHTPPALNPPTWSLEVEMQFYLIFPWLLAAYVRLWRYHAWPVTVVPPLVFLVFTVWVHAVGGDYTPVRWTVLGYLNLFLLGISVARQEMGERRQAMLTRRTYDALFGIGFLLLLGTGLFRDRQQALFYALREAATMMAVVLLYYGAMRGGIVTRMLCNRWVTLGGAMSYSLYLTHVAVIQVTGTFLFKALDLHSDVANLAVALAAQVPPVLIAGALYYILVERAFMRLGRHARQPPAEPSPSIA